MSVVSSVSFLRITVMRTFIVVVAATITILSLPNRALAQFKTASGREGTVYVGGLYGAPVGKSVWAAAIWSVGGHEADGIVHGSLGSGGGTLGIGFGSFTYKDRLAHRGFYWSLTSTFTSSTPTKGPASSFHIGPELGYDISLFHGSIGAGFLHGTMFTWSVGIAVPIW